MPVAAVDAVADDIDGKLFENTGRAIGRAIIDDQDVACMFKDAAHDPLHVGNFVEDRDGDQGSQSGSPD
jgi:hypothetical protein